MCERLSGKRILYVICFAFLCLIDQQIKTGSGHDGWIEAFQDMTGVVMAILVLSHYRVKDFQKNKRMYIVWGIVGGISAIIFIMKGQELCYFRNARVVLAADILLWGIVVIRTAERLLESGFSKFLRKPFLCVWLLMMGLMCAFRQDIHWQAAYLVFFGCFYLTEISGEERRNLFQGMLDGVILAFFLMQGWCLVFRPYDVVRYVGVYANCNQNALFYLVVLAAVLTRLLYAYAEEKDVKALFWRKAGYWVLSGALLGFLFLTISRTGYLTAGVLVVTAFFMRWRVVQRQKWIMSMLQSGMILGLCALLTFPAVFGAVRYLPAMFHHPVWFWGEWSEEKVHSWDPWDSEKYIDFEEFFEKAASRVSDILLGEKEQEGGEEITPGVAPENAAETTASETVSEAEAATVSEVASETVPEAVPEGASEGDTSERATEQMEKPADISDLQWERYQEMLAKGYGIDVHLMEHGEENSMLIRSTIYRYYLNKMNLTGYPADEQGFQMLPYYWVGHAHNIYLQWGLEFGVIVMILFLVLILWTILCLGKRFHKERDVEIAGSLLLFLIPCVFGLLEYCWGAGSLTIFMMFFVWSLMVRKVE